MYRGVPVDIIFYLVNIEGPLDGILGCACQFVCYLTFPPPLLRHRRMAVRGRPPLLDIAEHFRDVDCK